MQEKMEDGPMPDLILLDPPSPHLSRRDVAVVYIRNFQYLSLSLYIYIYIYIIYSFMYLSLSLSPYIYIYIHIYMRIYDIVIYYIYIYIYITPCPSPQDLMMPGLNGFDVLQATRATADPGVGCTRARARDELCMRCVCVYVCMCIYIYICI